LQRTKNTQQKKTKQRTEEGPVGIHFIRRFDGDGADGDVTVSPAACWSAGCVCELANCTTTEKTQVQLRGRGTAPSAARFAEYHQVV
jgi:hypothetical protein